MSFNLFGRGFHFLADNNQQEKALYMLEKYILKPEIIVIVAILLIYFIIRVVVKTGKKEEVLKRLKKISPWVYLLIIFGITVFNRAPGDREIRLTFDNWFTQTGFHETNVLGFVFNLALYIPFGYLLYKYGKAVSAVIIVCASSFIVETLQYILARGVAAIDDLVANIIGGLVGLGFAVLLQKIKDNKQ